MHLWWLRLATSRHIALAGLFGTHVMQTHTCLLPWRPLVNVLNICMIVITAWGEKGKIRSRGMNFLIIGGKEALS